MNLHQEFRKLAFDINKMKNRLIMILMKIYQKEIYKQYGCSTIYEYGFKYAKFSKETVQLALRTLKNTENKPLLREKIATQGIYKVSMIAKLATPETDKLYAEHVENMSKSVLFEFAKEMRNENLNGQYQTKCQAITPKITIELDEEMQILFNQLKKRYAKDLSNKEALKVILKNISGNGILENSKSAMTQKKHNNQKDQNTPNKSEKYQQRPAAPLLPSRYVLVQTQRKIDQKTNGKCAYPACTRPIENFHHTIPFSFNRNHNSLVGLCKIHHSFCHNGVIKNELKDPNQWKLSLKPEKSLFDSFYLKYKTGSWRQCLEVVL